MSTIPSGSNTASHPLRRAHAEMMRLGSGQATAALPLAASTSPPPVVESSNHQTGKGIESEKAHQSPSSHPASELVSASSSLPSCDNQKSMSAANRKDDGIDMCQGQRDRSHGDVNGVNASIIAAPTSTTPSASSNDAQTGTITAAAADGVGNSTSSVKSHGFSSGAFSDSGSLLQESALVSTATHNAAATSLTHPLPHSTHQAKLSILSPRSSPSSSPSPSASLPSLLPSLPDRHRLLYSFFQLLLRQSSLKLMLTSPSLWNMLSDHQILHTIITLIHTMQTPEIAKHEAWHDGKENEKAGQSMHQTFMMATSSASSSRHGLGVRARAAFNQARDRVKHARLMMSRRRAQLRLLQQLLDHPKCQLWQEEMMRHGVHVHMAQTCTEIIQFIRSEQGQTFTLALMHGMERRDSNSTVDAAGMAASSSHRLASLLRLLSQPSTTRLLCSSRLWHLLLDTSTLRLICHGQFIALVKQRRKEKYQQQQQNLAPMTSPSSSLSTSTSMSMSPSGRDVLKGGVGMMKYALHRARAVKTQSHLPHSRSPTPPSTAPRASLPGLIALRQFMAILNTIGAIMMGNEQHHADDHDTQHHLLPSRL